MMSAGTGAGVGRVLKNDEISWRWLLANKQPLALEYQCNQYSMIIAASAGTSRARQNKEILWRLCGNEGGRVA